MGWDWSSFFGTALGCALGWYIFPRIGAWVKFKRGLKRNPAGRQANCRQKQRERGGADALHHCVGTYAKDHANGKTAIFFIRRAKAPRKSFYTLELNEGKLVVRQNRGRRNCARTKEVEELEAVWLAWLKAGAPRDAKGRPVVPEQSKQKEVTAA